MTLNPALSGYTEKGRITANYRRQSLAFGIPYVTYALSFDAAIVKSKRRNNMFGGGILISNDKSGDGNLSSLKILLSGSYHKALDLLHANNIAIGGQLGLVHKSVNPDNLTFPNQYNDTNFDSNLPSGENFKGISTIYPDAAISFLWYYFQPFKPSYHWGIAFSHVNFPNESFLGEENHLRIKVTTHGGTKFNLNYKTFLSPKAVIIHQGLATEVNFGANVEYNLIKEKASFLSVFSGGWYRVSNSAIIVAGLEYNQWRFGATYDFNVASIKQDIGGKTALEFSLTYTADFLKPVSKICCPRFY